jgi:hypothetical protein
MPKPLTPPDDELGIDIPVYLVICEGFYLFIIFNILFSTGPPARRLPTFIYIDYVLKDYVCQ